MKFFRRLAAVLVVVAAVVVLGVAWEHSSEAGWIAAPRLDARQILPGPPAGPAPGRVAGPASGGVAAEGGAGFDPSNAGNLARTAEIEAGVVAAVVALDAARRRWRRARRAMR